MEKGTEDIKKEIQTEIEAEIKSEVKEEVKEEVRDEIKEKMKNEIKDEIQSTTTKILQETKTDTTTTSIDNLEYDIQKLTDSFSESRSDFKCNIQKLTNIIDDLKLSIKILCGTILGLYAIGTIAYAKYIIGAADDMIIVASVGVIAFVFFALWVQCEQKKFWA